MRGRIIISLFYTLAPLWGQEVRATILGRVSDQTDAVIAGARVEAANTSTGVRYTSQTNESGDYMLPFLIPGPYRVKVESPGFRSYTRSGIVVRESDRVTIDVTMQVGDASQVIEVSAQAPLLDTSTASMGQVIESRTILELPLKDGMVLIMATFSPGVTFTPESAGYVRPFDTSSPSTMSASSSTGGVRSPAAVVHPSAD